MHVQVVIDCPEPSMNFEVWSEMEKSRVRLVVLEAYESFNTDRDVQIQTEPTKAVLARGDIIEGKLCLVPLTTAVQLSVAEPQQAARVCRAGLKHPKTQEPIFVALSAPRLSFSQVSRRTGTCSATVQEELVVPYWVVRTTADSNEANTTYAYMNVPMVIGNIEYTYHVPVLKNTKALANGEELLVYKSAKRFLPDGGLSGKTPPTKNTQPQPEKDDTAGEEPQPQKVARGGGAKSKGRGRGRKAYH